MQQTVDLFAHFGVLDDDARLVQAREVERLADGRADGAAILCRFDAAHGRVARAGELNVAVNLVGDDPRVVPCQQRGQLRELLARPDAADGVVRVAEQHAARAGFERFFNAVKIHAVPAALAFERHVVQLAAGAGHDLVKCVVHRAHDNDAVARGGHGVQHIADHRDDADAAEDVLRPEVKAVAAGIPAAHGLDCALRRNAVAEDRMVAARVQRLRDFRQRGKVHVGDPEGRDRLRRAERLGDVPLDAGRSASVDGRGKIVHRVSSFY